MFGSAILEVAIGIFLVFLVVSLFTSQIAEAIASTFEYRAKDLRRGLKQLLGGEGPQVEALVNSLYKHPLIKGLFSPRGPITKALASLNLVEKDGDLRDLRLPSYIPAKNFATALVDQLKLLNQHKDSLSYEARTIASAIQEFSKQNNLSGDNSLARVLNSLLEEADRQNAVPADPAGVLDEPTVAEQLPETPEGLPQEASSEPSSSLVTLLRDNEFLREDFKKLLTNQYQNSLLVDNLQAGLESWYDSFTERLSGAYKRNIRWLTLFIGLIISALFNIDSLAITKQLWRDPTVREAIVAAAEQRVNQANGAPDTAAELEQQTTDLSELEALQLPIGWPDDWEAAAQTQDPRIASTTNGWLLKLVGWLITGFAASQGAPFWFDLLNRVVNVRNSGHKPNSATPET